MQTSQMNISFGDSTRIVGSPIGAQKDVNITNTFYGSPHQPTAPPIPIANPQQTASPSADDNGNPQQTVSPTSDDRCDSSSSSVSVEYDAPTTSFPKVMLSYNWGSSLTVNKIYKNLKQAGFKVWIDKKDMEGDMYESMGKAVREADVVITCLSNAYERSANAMKEAKHAAVKNKHIIPILVEENYRPSGAVDFIISGTIYIDFCSGSFDRRMKELKTRLLSLNSQSQQHRHHPKPVKSSFCTLL